MAFRTPIDIAKRACQNVGQFPLTTFQDDSRQADEVNTAYDDLRLAELSRHTWAFSIRRARVRPLTLSSQVWTPPTYSAVTTYTTGQCVNYAGGTYLNAQLYPWILQAPTSVGQNPDVTAAWSHMFSSMIADIFDNGATYAAGELSLVPALYAGGTTYALSAIVSDSNGLFWVSLQAANTGHTPSTSPIWWTRWITQSSGLQATPPLPVIFQTAPSIYLSIANNNGPVAPAIATTNPGSIGNLYWTLVGGTVAQLSILWPVGAGPVNSGTNFNLFPLPFGWLRPSIYYAKETAHPWLGALYGPGDAPDEYTYYGSYFSGPASMYMSNTPFIDLTFIADIADVTVMPPLYCESLALRIAKAIDGALTESKNVQKLEREYNKVTGEAMRIDAIIQGTPTQPIEELIRVRL